MSTKKMTEDELLKIIKKKNILIACLFLLLIAGIFWGYKSINVKSVHSRFVGGVPEPTAEDAVNAHRDRFTPFRTKAFGVWYDTASIRKYLDSTFIEIVKRQNEYISTHRSIDTNTYKWKVGFYWMMKHGGKNEGMKEDFYVVPILVNKNDSLDVKDFFAPKDVIYSHRFDKSSGAFAGKKDTFNITDAGALWP